MTPRRRAITIVATIALAAGVIWLLIGDPEVAAIEQCIRDGAAAVEAADVPTLLPLLHTRIRISGGHRTFTKEDIERRGEAMIGNAGIKEAAIRSISVNRSGDRATAVAHLAVSTRHTIGSKYPVRVTLELQRAGDNDPAWQITRAEISGPTGQ